jgi:hypothetical protein
VLVVVTAAMTMTAITRSNGDAGKRQTRDREEDKNRESQ